jgi:phosphoglycerate dehydrogenase-like enzyme
MKVLIVLSHRFELWNAPSWVSERLRQDFRGVEVVHLTRYEGLESELKDAEVAITWSLRPEQFAQAKELRWIHSPAAAVHQLMFPELVHSEVILTNAREVHGPVVAEHVLALIFALAKRIPEVVRFQQKHQWGQERLWKMRPRPREIAGATVGLIGLGSIGREVAIKSHAVGMRVLAVREHPEKDKPEYVEEVFPHFRIDRMLQQSDYVVLAAPLTAETRSLMNSARLGNMKPEACLINVGRGPLVDEQALFEALQARRIGGAALDVFEKEPLPSESPLWDLDNLLITPHSAGLTEKLWERHYALISENLRRYMDRQTLLAVVDKKRGY